MPKLKVIQVMQDSGDYSGFDAIILAQGDSWFSIGAIPFTATSNILFEMSLRRAACAVNCARPGATLRNMVEWVRQPEFTERLSGIQVIEWSAVFISGGGNDLINAVNARCSAEFDPEDQQHRLLLTRNERGGAAAASPAGYISEPGWRMFRDHLTYHFLDLVEQREAGKAKGSPMFFHTYDYPTPRNAPAGLGFGPWLYDAMLEYEVPPADWDALATELIKRLAALLSDIIVAINGEYGRDMNLHLINSLGKLDRAADGTSGRSGDWQNEIHPTRAGYGKLAQTWTAAVDPLI